MMTRFALLDLIARARLDAHTSSRLWQMAGYERPPGALLPRLRTGLALFGAGCAGLGLLFWVAANWGVLSRFQQFALLQTLVAVLCGGAVAWPRARAPFGLLALVAVGGLFACFGQTYQTGADPWQLFALWAGLTLPLAAGVRSDAVWTAWSVVALIAVTLWDRSHLRSLWDSGRGAEGVHALAMLMAGLLTAAMSARWRRLSGAGRWAFGTALVLSMAFVTGMALLDLDGASHPVYFLGLLAAGGAAIAFAVQAPFDVFAASVAALALNILLVAGLAVLLLSGSMTTSATILMLLVIGLVAAGLLAGTAKIILDLARRPMAQGGTA